MARQASDGGLQPEAPEHEDSSRASEDVQTPTLDPEAGSAARSPRPQGLDKRKSKFVSMPLLQEEIEAVTDAYATADESWSKTWSRLLVENYLQNYKWYFPRKDDTKPDAPKLTKAWAYYEHITLARYFSDSTGNDRKKTRAEPGEMERETVLYGPFSTRESDLNEWGVGVGLYFSTLRAVAIILIVAGLINIPSILFYASSEYSAGQDTLNTLTLVGSAVCTEVEWVVCEDCQEDQWNQSFETRSRIGVTGETVLVLRNACEGAQLSQGMVNWGTLFFLIICFGLLACFQRAREVRFDEDKLTAPDYTLVVKNPPKDVYDPDEWRDFFSQFAEKQVTCVTVALNNGELMWKLALCRIWRNSLRLQLPKSVDLDDEDVVRTAVAQVEKEWEKEDKSCFTKLIGCTVLPILRIFGMFLPPHILVDKIFKVTEEIKELEKRKYDVIEVYVTFETEAGQRTALSALTVPGRLDLAMQNTSRVAPSALFQGKMLRVEEATEPNAVRWLDIEVSTMRKIMIRLMNLGITVALICLAGLIVARVRNNIGPALAAIFVTVFNSSIPQVLKLLMMFERHSSEGSRQKSLYLKITLFRWVNTAILTKFITPFTSTIGTAQRDVLPTINAILWSELLVAPALRVIDIMSTLKKHFLAPRARNQEEMNLSFQGTPYTLAERYTDFTKVLFLCFFYSALFPYTFFFCAAILIVQYYVDKFCLMRVWEPAPLIGPQLAEYSRRYFFTGALLAYAVVSSYAWAQFPYDNLCLPENPNTGYAGTYDNVQILNGTLLPEVIVTFDQGARFCSQNRRDFDGFAFPATPRLQSNGLRWMDDSQETLTSIYGITSVIVLVVFIVVVFGGLLIKYSLGWFRGMYKPAGEDQKIDFSNVAEISVYVPFIRIRAFPYPLLACDVDDIPQTLIGWTDKFNTYDVHNMIFDVPYEGMKRRKRILTKSDADSKLADHESYEQTSAHPIVAEESEGDQEGKVKPRPIFSIVKHYPRPFPKEK